MARQVDTAREVEEVWQLQELLGESKEWQLHPPGGQEAEERRTRGSSAEI